MNKLHKLTLGTAAALLWLPGTSLAVDQDKYYGDRSQKSQQHQSQLGQSQSGERGQMGQQQRGQIGERGQSSERGQMGQGQGQDLQVGFDKQTVMEIQRALSSEGHEIEVDGLFGPQTQQALRSYQQEEELDATGWPDNKTLSQLGIDEEGAWRASFDFEGQRQQQGGSQSQQQRLGQERSQSGERGQLGRQGSQTQEGVGTSGGTMGSTGATGTTNAPGSMGSRGTN